MSNKISEEPNFFKYLISLNKISRFLFGKWLKPFLVTNISSENNSVLCTVAYKDYKKTRHKRTVQLGDQKMHIKDEVANFNHKAILRWRLTDANWSILQKNNEICISCDLGSLKISSDVSINNANLSKGLESKFYMQKKDITVLEVEINKPGTLISEFTWPS